MRVKISMRSILKVLMTAICLTMVPSAVFALQNASYTELNSSGTLNRSVSIDPVGRQDGFSAVLYNNTNGLPTSEANAIAETVSDW